MQSKTSTLVVIVDQEQLDKEDVGEENGANKSVCREK